MADDEYEAKFQEMQKHIPFIHKVIEKLKIANDPQGDNPRKAQLEKMETLHELLTNRAKKLKLDTLIKFEGVLIKLHAKIEKNDEPPQKSLDSPKSKPPILTEPHKPSPPSASAAAATATTSEATKRLANIRAISSAPSSPSPERIVDKVEPVVIPTERRDSPFELIDKEKRPSSRAGKAKDSKHRHPEHQMQRAVHLDYQQPQHHLKNSPKAEETNSSRSPKNSRNDSTQDNNERNDKHGTPPNVYHSRIGKSSSNFRPIPTISNRTITKDTHRDSPFNINNQNQSQKKDSSSSSKAISTTTPPVKSSCTPLVQSVQVIITEPLPASLVQQHFPPQHQSRYHQPMQQHSPVTREHHQWFSNNVEIIPQPMTPSLAQKTNDKAYNPEECWQKYNETKNISLPLPKNSVFSRLGDKVVPNDSPIIGGLKVLTPKPSTPPVASIPTPAPTRTQTPIPEVLKSPPLSYIDINNLLKESGGDQPIPDISEIGTRRPKKKEHDECKSSLEFVRRKFAQIAKINSPPTVIPSPPPALTEPKTEEKATPSCAENVSAMPRLALKYNPHPRKDRLLSLSSNDGSECSQQSFGRVVANSSDPRLKLKSLLSPGVNAMPALITNDPRLKKVVVSHDTLPMPSSGQPAAIHPTNVFGVRPDPRIARQQQSLSSTSTQIGPQQGPKRRMSISNPFKTAEENWDTDSSTTSSMHGRSPVRVPPISQPVYGSSEENWDSEPEVVSSMNNNNNNISLNKPSNVLSNHSAAMAAANLYAARRQDPRMLRNPQPDENWDLDMAGNRKNDCNYQRQMSVGPDRSSMNQLPVRRHSQSSREIPPVVARENTWCDNPKDNQQPKENPMSRNPNTHSASFNPFARSAHTTDSSNRFNYATNDSTERKKYFESKKQKSIGPRTYKEHKEARDEFKRTVMVPERKFEKKQDNVMDAAKKKFPEEKSLGKDKQHKNVKNKIEQHHNNKDKDKDKNNTKDKDKELEKDKELAIMQSVKAVAAVTTLDKMYRSQNFNAEFPKTTLSFKIPKKKTEETTINKPATQQPAIDPPPPPPNAAPKDNQKKPLHVKSKSKEKLDKNGSNNKKPAGQKTKQLIKSSNAGEKLEIPIIDLDAPKPGKPKAAKQQTESEVMKKEAATAIQNNKETIGLLKPLNVRDPRNTKREGGGSLEIATESKIADDAMSTKKETKTKEKTEVVAESKTDSASAKEDVCLTQKMKEKNYIEKIKVFMDANKTTATIVPKVDNLTAFSAVSTELKPQRILRRRCTMVTIGSEPLVDKDKLMKANALMLEDIEARDKLKRKKDEEERQTARRNKHLSEMFQKTDDNCSVSTQNIITGKRSTRASINFNETQNALKVFKHMTIRDTSSAAAATPSSPTSSIKSVKKLKATKAVTSNTTETAVSEKMQQKSQGEQCALQEQENKKAEEANKPDKHKESLNKISKAKDAQSSSSSLEAKKSVDKQQQQQQDENDGNSSKTELDIAKNKIQFDSSKKLSNAKVKLAAIMKGNKEAKDNSEECRNETMLADGGSLSDKSRRPSSSLFAEQKEDKKPEDDEHQNCAVSSTSAELPPAMAENPPTTTAAEQDFKTEAADNEPSSTASKSSIPTPTPPTEDDESSRHEFLNKFVQEIIKPHADKQHILSLLGQILSEDKLQFIKSVIDSSTTDDKAKDTASTTDENAENLGNDNEVAKIAENKNERHESEDDEEVVEIARNQPQSKKVVAAGNSSGRKTPTARKKRNELDRLNEDIRDMFICEGVLTATGKRMCTLMQNNGKKDSAGDSMSTSLSEIKKNAADYNNSSAGGAIKRSVGRPRKQQSKPLRRSLRASKSIDVSINTNIYDDNDVDDDDDDDEVEVTTFNDNENSRDNDDAIHIAKKMPVLKPYSPIKLPEELETIVGHDKHAQKRKANKLKPCPKSKKIKLYNATETNEDFESSSDSECESELNSIEEASESSNRKHLEITKNSNIHWHNQSKYTSWCALCSKKIPASRCSFHYKLHHGENYISRLAPVILQKFKKGKLSTPLFGVDKAAARSLWFYKCPFCLQYFNTPMQLWLEHFQNHTAEFRYECSKCHWGCNRLVTTRRHINSNCKGAKIDQSTVKLEKPFEIKAHVCHLCNFIQLKRANLDRHYVEQHDVDEKNVDILGYTITLFNCDDVEMVAEDKAQTKEDEVRKLIEAQEKIIELKDEDTWHNDNKQMTDEKKKNEANKETKGKEGGIEVKQQNNPEDESEFEILLNKEIEEALKSQEPSQNDMPNVESKAETLVGTKKLSKTPKEAKIKLKPIKLKIILPAKPATQLPKVALESGDNTKGGEKPKDDFYSLKVSEEEQSTAIVGKTIDKASTNEAKTSAGSTQSMKQKTTATVSQSDGHKKNISESETKKSDLPLNDSTAKESSETLCKTIEYKQIDKKTSTVDGKTSASINSMKQKTKPTTTSQSDGDKKNISESEIIKPQQNKTVSNVPSPPEVNKVPMDPEGKQLAEKSLTEDPVEKRSYGEKKILSEDKVVRSESASDKLEEVDTQKETLGDFYNKNALVDLQQKAPRGGDEEWQAEKDPLALDDEVVDITISEQTDKLLSGLEAIEELSSDINVDQTDKTETHQTVQESGKKGFHIIAKEADESNIIVPKEVVQQTENTICIKDHTGKDSILFHHLVNTSVPKKHLDVVINEGANAKKTTTNEPSSTKEPSQQLQNLQCDDKNTSKSEKAYGVSKEKPQNISIATTSVATANELSRKEFTKSSPPQNLLSEQKSSEPEKANNASKEKHQNLALNKVLPKASNVKIKIMSPKFNANLVSATYAKKKVTSVAATTTKQQSETSDKLNESKDDSCTLVSENMSCRILQDELLTLAAKAAEEEEIQKNEISLPDIFDISNKNVSESSETLQLLLESENIRTSDPDQDNLVPTYSSAALKASTEYANLVKETMADSTIETNVTADGNKVSSNTTMSDLISNSIDILYRKRKSDDMEESTGTKRSCLSSEQNTKPTTSNAFIQSTIPSEVCTQQQPSSPPIHILAQSIITIDSVNSMNEIDCNDKPQTISIAERLSQRFKLLQEKANKAGNLEKPGNAADCKNGLNESVAIKDSQISRPINLNDVVTVISDDEDWEDIEITESAPNPVPANNLQKTKNKGLFQKFGLFKPNANRSKKQNITPLAFMPKNKKPKDKQQVSSSQISSPMALKPFATADVSASSSLLSSSVHLGFKSVINNIEDLLPDSPCNDPIDMVPELTPFEPLTDLNDISSILDSNLSINMEESQTCIQDALDFISEQQANDEHQAVATLTSLPAEKEQHHTQTKFHKHKIQHVGYSLQTHTPNGGIKFYCLLEKCSFLFSSDAIGLENHFLCEHAQTKWNGYCSMCQTQCLAKDHEYNIVTEIKHMLDCHVNGPSSSSAAAESNSNDSSQHSTTHISQTAEERPRIKLRRLTGDCLSTSNSESPTPSVSATGAPSTMAGPAPANMLLGALLNAKQMPPTKEMPPHPEMPLTEPLLMDGSSNTDTSRYTNLTNDIQITSVSSAADNVIQVPQCNAAAPTPIFDSLNNNNMERPIDSNVMPNTKTTASLSSQKVGSLWYQQVVQEKQDLLESRSAALEMSSIIAKARRHSIQTVGGSSGGGGGGTPRSLNDSPGPVIVSETVPMAQEKRGDFVITQTISTQYDDYASAAVGINISIEVPPTTPLLNSSMPSEEVLPPSAAATFENNSPLIEMPSQLMATANDEDSRNSLSGFYENRNSPAEMITSACSTTPPITSRQYKCMAHGCKFTSRVPVAMSDHLRFHERRNFSNNRDYFDCAFCTYKATDVDDYINHSDLYHIINKGSKYDTIPSASTSVKGNICDILSKKMETNAQRNLAALREAQKLSLAKQKESEQEYLKKLQLTIEEIVGATGLSDDKLYRCVIKNCPTKLNEATFHNHILYHISTLGISNPNTYIFKCPHCMAQYQRPTGIKAHIKSHARNRYFCYMCDFTSANPNQMMKHFCDKHWYTMNMFTTALLKPKVTLSADGSEKLYDSGYYVTYSSELSEAEVRKYGEKLILEWQRKKSGSKTHFKSSEIDLLPIQPIFQREVNCGECQYKTKVRTNMLRHLSMHKLYAQQPHATQSLVASVDPVNPVPCLNSNERFFDKMTNLASSSLVPSSGIAGGVSAASKAAAAYKLSYDFISDEKRFKCGVANCNYTTITENEFRSHLTMTHSAAQAYRCPFCQEEICKRGITIERVINHLRFHGQTLYRCEECNYVHPLKFIVERHINDKHATMKLNIVRHDRIDDIGEGTMTMSSFSGRKYKEPSEAVQQQHQLQQQQEDFAATTTATTTTRSLTKGDNAAKPSYSSSSAALTGKSKSKWKCNLCNHTASSLNFIQAHCQNSHGQNQQYQCMHCTFGSHQLSNILYHVDEKHSGKAREARYIYHKVINSNEMDVADTRPLWQRNDPTRGRHIRGIQMEDEEESAKYRNINADDDDDDEDNDNEGADQTQTNEMTSIANFFKGYEFSCFHCDYKTRDFQELSAVHHKTSHSNDEETSKPFMFRLIRRVCCPECRKFVGNFCDLQLHLQNIHNVRQYYAADISVAEADDASQRLVCAYCPFSCKGADQLSKHYQSPKVNHAPQDMHIVNDLQISEMNNMGGKQTYFRCTLCTELLSNRVSIVHHATNQHENEEGFSFRELSNTLLYHCALCSYSATTESVLLRHMIDHYGRFKRCHFCHEPQVSFEVYMQHCDAEHRDNIRKFKELYQYREIRKFLLQMYIVFPNGLVISKRNLMTSSAYGSEKAFQELYEEIYKISQQPPIPRLSIARLVARKSIEAYQRQGSSPQDSEIDLANAALPNNTAPQIAKKISKRKSDVSLGQDETSGRSMSPTIVVPSTKKPKTSSTVEDDTSSNQSSEFNVPRAHAIRPKKRRRLVRSSHDKQAPTDYTSTEEDIQSDAEYYSYYGIKPEPIDLSKVYTKLAVGGINTPLSLAKVRKLFNIDCQLKLTKCDVSNLPTYIQYKHVRKACPASHKLNYN